MTLWLNLLVKLKVCRSILCIESNHAKDIPETLKVSILMKGFEPGLLTLVMPQNPRRDETSYGFGGTDNAG